MITSEDKQIAKELVLAMIEKDLINFSQHPNAETPADMVCADYETILKTVSKTSFD